MAQPPEIELIDQLSGSTMPLDVALGLFATESEARRVIAIYLKKEIVLLCEHDSPLPQWRALDGLRDMGSGELRARGWMLALTDQGVAAFETGNWERI